MRNFFRPGSSSRSSSGNKTQVLKESQSSTKQSAAAAAAAVATTTPSRPKLGGSSPSDRSLSTQGRRGKRGLPSAGKWLSLTGISFDEFDPNQGRVESKGSLKGRLAVQARPDGNGVVAFRSAPALSPDAVTIIKLSAAGRLDNRLSIGVVNEHFKPSKPTDVANGDVDADMVCNGVTGIGTVLSADEFVSEVKKDERVSLVVQIDILERELIVFRTQETTNTDTKNNISSSTQRCFNESQDVLVAALKIPSHWQTCYFAVDLYGYGDQVLLEDASRWVSNKKRRTNQKSSVTSSGAAAAGQAQRIGSLPTRQRTMLEALMDMNGSGGSKHKLNTSGKINNVVSENPLGPKAGDSSALTWANGIMPLLSQSTLRDLTRSKNSNTVVDLSVAVKFQSWLYHSAVALKPIVTQDGMSNMREPLVAPLCLGSLEPSERGVTLRLIRDAHRQCGQVAVLPTTTVREMAPQLIAWSREYACSTAEVLGSHDEYLSAAAMWPANEPSQVSLSANAMRISKSVSDMKSSSNLSQKRSRRSTRTSRADVLSFEKKLSLRQQRYACDEVKPAAHYLCYSWDMPWRVLVDDSIPRGLVGFHEDDPFWIDIFGFNYAGRLGPGQASPLPSIQRTIKRIGSTVVLVDEAATALSRLWCLVEILMTVSLGKDAQLVMCFLGMSGSSTNDALISVILATAGRFDTLIDVGTAKCAGSKQEHRVLRGWLQREFKSDKLANAAVCKAVSDAARSVLETDKRAGFSATEIDASVKFVQEIGVHHFVDANGYRNQANWEILERFTFPSI